MGKVKIAVCYGSICGGCDVAFVDLGEKIMELVSIADIVYWAGVMDAKEEDLRRTEEIDIGIFFGGIRTEKHREAVKLLREKSRILVAFGTCSCYGGVPGLGNSASLEDLLKTGYLKTASTENPERNIPGVDLKSLIESVPKLRRFLSPICEFVDVDIWVPGCPPPVESIEKLIEVIRNYSKGRSPRRGLFIAEDRCLCDFCERQKPEELSIKSFRRVHEGVINKEECFLKQGIICLGPVTRGGCGLRCIAANMPCRGCFGPIPGVEDQGTRFLTAVASALGAGEEKEIGEEELKKLIDELPDPLGLFYMFSLASSIINKRYSDLGGEESE